MVPLYQSVISGLLIRLSGEIAGSLGVYSIHRPDINLAEGKPYIATVKLLNF